MNRDCDCASTDFSRLRHFDFLQVRSTLQGSTQVEDHVGPRCAAVGGLIVRGPEVSVATGGFTRGAVDFVAGGVVGGNAEADLVEQRRGLQVDQRDIPPDSRLDQSVFELQDVGLAGRGGDLDGDTTLVRVEQPVLGVGLAVSQSDHFTGRLAGGPQVDGLADGVLDGHTTAGGAGAAARGRTGRRGRGRRRGGAGGPGGGRAGRGRGGVNRRRGGSRRAQDDGRRRGERGRRRARGSGRGRGNLEELGCHGGAGRRGRCRRRAGGRASTGRSGAIRPEVLTVLHALADLASGEALSVELVDIDHLGRDSRGRCIATVQVAVTMAMGLLGGNERARRREDESGIELHRE